MFFVTRAADEKMLCPRIPVGIQLVRLSSLKFCRDFRTGALIGQGRQLSSRTRLQRARKGVKKAEKILPSPLWKNRRQGDPESSADDGKKRRLRLGSDFSASVCVCVCVCVYGMWGQSGKIL